MVKTLSHIGYVLLACLILAGAVGCGTGYVPNAGGTPGSVTLTTTALPQAVVGVGYTGQLAANGGVAPYTFAVDSGLIPAGFTMTASGVFGGTAAAAAVGTYTFVASVTDGLRQRSTATVSLVVRPSGTVTAVALQAANPAAGISGKAYSGAIVASGGVAPYGFVLTGGAMPAGVTLSSAGALVGTPAAVGTFSFSVGVTDTISQKANGNFSWTIVAPLQITTVSLPAASTNVAYSAQIAATGGSLPYSFAVTAGTLPRGFSLSTSGVVSGGSSTTESGTFTVTVTDANGLQASANFSVGVALGAFVLTTTALPNGTVGTAYSGAVSGANGLAPYTFAVTGGALPAGVSLLSNGNLSGTPTAAGTSSVTITGSDSTGSQSAKTFSIVVGPAAQPLALSSAMLPGGTVGTAYAASVAASGGTAPYSYAVTSGAFPAGLVLASNGGLSGTPSALGQATATITVTDAAGTHASQSYTVAVVGSANPLHFATNSLATANVGVAYGQTITAGGGTSPYSFAVSAGTLPAGFTLTSGGLLSGTFAMQGSATFTVTVTDAIGSYATATFTLATAAPLTLTQINVPNAVVGQAYSLVFSAVNGTAPYSFALIGGTAPAGMTLSGTGVLGGSATTAGSYTFTVSATDAAGLHASATFTVVVVPAAVSVTTASVPDGIVGVLYSATITAANGTAPYSFGVSNGALPSGVTMSPIGAIYGRPTATGTYSFTVTVTDSTGATALDNYTMKVVPALAITTAALPSGAVGSAYSAAISYVNGTGPFTFQVTMGSVPAGLTLSNAGVLSGTPAGGSSTFTVSLYDQAGQTASQTYTVSIATGQSLMITTPQPGNAYTNYAYDAPWYAAGGTAPYTFAVTAGAVPVGMTFANAHLSGTPTVAGKTSFTITVTDAAGATSSTAYTLLVVSTGQALTITTPALGQAYQGFAYDATFYAGGGTPNYTFAITAGAIPAGMTFANAHLSGTPALGGTVNFTVTVTDAAGGTASQAYTLVVQKTGQALAITTPQLGPGYVGASYTAQWYAAYGSTPYAFAVTAGALPPGMTLTSPGAFSGVPTAGGSYNFTVTVTDNTAATASQVYTLVIVGGQLVVTTTSLPGALVNAAYSQAIQMPEGPRLTRFLPREHCLRD